MKYYYWILTVVLSGVGMSYGQDQLPVNVPTTQPAQQMQAPAVLVLPFNNIGEAGSNQWLSQALAQNMVVDLSKTQGIIVISPGKFINPPENLDAAIKIAKDMHAPLVVYGTYQVVEGQVRVLGQVVDVTTGQIVGTLKTNGASRDLFTLEDDLSNQLKGEMIAAGRLAAPPIVTYGEPTAPYEPSAPSYESSSAVYPPANYPQGPTTYYPQDYYGPDYYSYGYPYAYSYVPYYYPSYYYGFSVGVPFYHHHHDFDHNHNHHDFNGDAHNHHDFDRDHHFQGHQNFRVPSEGRSFVHPDRTPRTMTPSPAPMAPRAHAISPSPRASSHPPSHPTGPIGPRVGVTTPRAAGHR